MARHEAAPRAHTVLSIQYLRGAAALAVTVSHIAGHAGLNAEAGAAGVDVFFVISGFIIWTMTAQRAAQPSRFLLDRLTRVAPPYILLTFAVYVLAITVPGAFPNMRTSLSHALYSAAFIPHRDPYGSTFPLIIPGWTLNYEIFFYLIFALALTAPRRARLVAVSGLLAALVVVGLVLPAANPVVDMVTNPLLLEFGAGIWLGHAWQNKALLSPGWGWAALAAGLAGLVAWQLCSGAEPVSARAVAWGAPAFLIVAGAVTLEQQGALPRARALLIIGDASFSIYLVNVFATAAVWRAVGGISVPAYCVAALLISAGAGIIFWQGVERPLTKLARRLVHRPAPAASLAMPSRVRS